MTKRTCLISVDRELFIKKHELTDQSSLFAYLCVLKLFNDEEA